AGLWDDLLPPSPNAPRFVYWNRKLRKIPFGPLTAMGILRVLREPLVRSKSPASESVRDFFTRRIGKQAHDRIVAPALTGIYAGNTANLSMAAVFPKIIEMERGHGSLAAAFLKSLGGKKKPATAATDRPKPKGAVFSFADGVETLPRRLAEQLRIEYNNKDARVGDAPVTVITVPAFRAVQLLQRSHSTLSSMLSRIEYAPMVIAAVSFP